MVDLNQSWIISFLNRCFIKNTFLILISLSFIVIGCGPNYKSHQMVNYELLTQPQKVERLKLECPKLVEQSLAFYEQAKQYHQSNDPEERDQYVLLARVTWQTAEEKANRLQYERQRADQKKRLEQAQKRYNDTLQRKNKLVQLQKQRQSYLSQTQNAAEMSVEERHAKEKQYQTLLKEVQKLDEQAMQVKAPDFASGPYKKAVASVKSANQMMAKGDLNDAIRFLSLAKLDFQDAHKAALPWFKEDQIKEKAKLQLMKLKGELAQMDFLSLSSEPRGLVMTVLNVTKRHQLQSSKAYIFERIAETLSQYAKEMEEHYYPLRLIIEGHTYKSKSRKVMLAQTEQLALDTQTVLNRALSVSNIKSSVIGQGDYVPVMSNPRNKNNERVVLILVNAKMKPRAKK